MKNNIEYLSGVAMKRVTKRVARSLYNLGYTIHCVPVNMTLSSMWHRPFTIQKELYSCEQAGNFDNVVNHIEYYNCNHETGYYLKYYYDNKEM